MRLELVAFAAGVALLQVQRELPAAYLLATLAVLAGVLVGARVVLAAGRVATLGALLAAALLGFCWAGWLAQQRLADRLPEAWEARDVTLIGVVASLPQRAAYGERFVFDVEACVPPQAHVPARIMLSWYRGRPADEESNAAPSRRVDAGDDERLERLASAVRPGERWRFTVRVKRPHGNANPHGFDYEAWLLERGIRATGSVRGEGERLDAFVVRPGTFVERLRDAIRSRFFTALPDAPYLGVLVALAVGDQRAIANEQWTVFNRTGITHLVSISGLHVTMVAALVAALAGWLWRRSERLMLWHPAQHAALVVAWLAAFGYALLAGFEVPAQRTLYMLSVVALAGLSGRNLGVARTLLLALVTVLVLDPWAVLATGFWLSFGAVALLLLAGSARLGRARGWRAALGRWGAAQWAVTVGSLPLLLFFFQQFSLVSPLANALAIPLVSLLITPLALIFAIVPWTPLLLVAHWLLAQLIQVLDLIAAWPLWQQAAQPWPTVVLALAGVGWLLLPRGFPARATGLALLLPALFWPAARPLPGTVWVDVLDVGQGLAVLVRTSSHALLYDSGPAYSSDANAGQRVVVPYLRAVGVGRLDMAVISHRDQDHSGGYASVRAALPVDRLLTSIVTLTGPSPASAAAERCRAGQRWEWDGVRFALLHPLADDYDAAGKRSNNMSCVLRVGGAAGDGAVLLTGDIEAIDEQAMRARSPESLRTALLVVPHHGGRASSSPAFVTAAGARDVVFSVGYRNAFGHPHPLVVERYAASRQWRTDRDGAVHAEWAGGAATVSVWRDEHRRYWYGQ